MKCINCNGDLTPQYRYCPSCSQTVHLQRLSLPHVGHETFHYFTHADKSIINLVRDLATRGGTVAREYVLGMRKRHFSPLSFFLMIAAIYLIVMNFENSPASEALRERPDLSQYYEGAELEKMQYYFQRQEVAVRYMQKKSNLVAIATVPITALSFFLFYRKRAFNYTEHLVATLYMSGFTTLFYIILIALNSLIRFPFGYLAAVYFPLQLAYYSWFYYRFMVGSGKPKVFLSALCGALIPGLIGGAIILLYTFDII